MAGGGVTKGRMRDGHRSRLAREAVGGVLRLTERHPPSLDSEPAVVSQRLFTIGHIIFSHSRGPGPFTAVGWKLPPPAFPKTTPWRLGISVRSELVSSNVRLGTRPRSCRQRRRFVTEPKLASFYKFARVPASSRLGTRLGSGVFTFLANSTRFGFRHCRKTLRNTPGGIAIRQRRLEPVLGIHIH